MHGKHVTQCIENDRCPVKSSYYDEWTTRETRVKGYRRHHRWKVTVVRVPKELYQDILR